MVVLIGLGLRRNARSGHLTEGAANQSGADWPVTTHHAYDHDADGGD